MLEEINSQNTWTVLIYAAGNNDLEPELYRAFQLLKNTDIPEDINVLVQFARSPKGIFMSKASFVYEKWDGTRRYLIKNKTAILLDDLGNVKMSKPETLFDFLIWGINSFPADHLMLIMSGHSILAGLMAEENPQQDISIMSIPGMMRALSDAQEKSGRKIDILLLDTCFMNMVEVCYEIALSPGHPVKYLILAQGNAPRQGLPCHFMIEQLKVDEHHKLKPDTALNNMVMSVNSNYSTDSTVFAVSLAEDHFLKLKELADKLAAFILQRVFNLSDILADCYSGQEECSVITLLYLLDRLNLIFPEIHIYKSEVFELLDKLVLYPALSQIDWETKLGPSILLPLDIQEYFQIKGLYDQLLFNLHNRWSKVLQEKIPKSEQTESTDTKQSIRINICN